MLLSLFSNRSDQNGVETKKMVYEVQLSASLLFLPHFYVFCNTLQNRPTTTWNLHVFASDTCMG